MLVGFQLGQAVGSDRVTDCFLMVNRLRTPIHFAARFEDWFAHDDFRSRTQATNRCCLSRVRLEPPLNEARRTLYFFG